MEDGYCVKWEKHHNAIVSVFDNLYKHNVLVDCTLAAENRFIKAHRIVLIACSPYFEDLLSQHSESYPIVWMNMKFSELQALIDFCYRGEVRLHQAELPGFLNAARLLHIKGLCESSEGYRKRRLIEGSSSSPSNVKKKYRVSSGGDGLVNQVSVDDVTSVAESASNESNKTKRSKGIAEDQDMVQTNGGDSLIHVRGEENWDRSDLDTDEESNTGEEKDSIMLDDLIRGSGVSQFLYRWTCSNCGEAFPTRAVFTEHKKSCLADPAIEHPWRCHKCPNTYKNKKDLVRHLLYCGTETERHICDRCGSTYKYERGLKRHKIYCGTNVKPMVCNACGKTYKYKRGLRRHQKQQCGLIDAYLENTTPKRRTSDAATTNEQAVTPSTSSIPKTSSTPLTTIKAEQEEDPETPQSLIKDGNAPAVCQTCGKVYKYRKSYLNHVVNCVPSETPEDDGEATEEGEGDKEKEEGKTGDDGTADDTADDTENDTPKTSLQVKAEVHATDKKTDDEVNIIKIEVLENKTEEKSLPEEESTPTVKDEVENNNSTEQIIRETKSISTESEEQSKQ